MRSHIDTKGMTEDDRIDLIGRTVLSIKKSSAVQPAIIGITVEDIDKAERYLRKINDKFPEIRHIDTTALSPDCLLVRIAGPLS